MSPTSIPARSAPCRARSWTPLRRTRAIDVPHITSKLGIVLPVARIAELARGKNIFVLVDGAQAIGQKRIDVKTIGCDAYTTSPHKWLLAPPGNGLLYVSAARQK